MNLGTFGPFTRYMQGLGFRHTHKRVEGRGTGTDASVNRNFAQRPLSIPSFIFSISYYASPSIIILYWLILLIVN